ncbi:MAG: hypothetical protein JWN61_700 [Pseudonocardiales bacterium]|nr:hypothetical protein [Jatrophihabitantaceae bacterium]MCW2602565.1 hypothetical protein [Pseudonocardiales bacterium]
MGGMTDAHNLHLVSCYLEEFAERLVAACGQVGTADAQTQWQSTSATAYRRHLVDLRVDLRAAAALVQDDAARFRALARQSAQSR